jgi:glycosyltransferase involved in cell wall biosynthesis
MIQTVLYYTDSTSFGGVETAMLHLLKDLDRTRWQPVLVHHREAGILPLLQEAARLDVRLVEMPHLPLGLIGARQLPAFGRMLRTERPAVFHAHCSWPLAGKWGLVSALLERVPAVVATLHLWVDAPYTHSTRWQQRLIATRMGMYVAVSREIAWKLEKIFHVPASKVQIIHSSVDNARFENAAQLEPPAELAAPQGPLLKQGRPIILTLARLDKQKGLPTLLDAAAQVPEAVFVIVGEGAERAALEAQRQALGLQDRVIFAGFRQDIPAWLGYCRLFVLPSIYEGVPLSVLEAMAAGKPVIASNIPGNDEAVVHAETGWLFPPGDATALAQAIRLLLANPDLAQRLALAGQVRARSQFSSQVMVQKVEQIYTELLEKAPKDSKRYG